MAKKAPEPCLFCGTTPCSCDGGTGSKKKRSTGTPRSSQKKSTSPTSDSPTPDSSSEPIAYDEPKAKLSPFKVQKRERDLSLDSALRCVREIVCPEDQRKIDEELRQPIPPDLGRRLAEWKARNGKT